MKILKEDHPLGIQVQPSNRDRNAGVSNRNVREWIALSHRNYNGFYLPRDDRRKNAHERILEFLSRTFGIERE